MKTVFVVLNPSAGQSDHLEVRKYFEQKCLENDWRCEFYETSGDHADAENLSQASEREYDIYAAAGGDGTVALVANAVINKAVPLAIIPIGTGNGAARVLDIPLDWHRAVDLLFQTKEVYEIDTFHIAGKHFLLHLGVGLSGKALRKTDMQSKRLLGRLYYPFEGLRAFFGYQPHRFEVTLDGENHSFEGTEMFVINSASIGDPFIQWSESITPNDGVLDVFFLRARTLLDLLRLAWNTLLGRQRMDPKVTYNQSNESIYVRSEPPLPIQADGEYVTETPASIELIRGALRVIGPEIDERGNG